MPSKNRVLARVDFPADQVERVIVAWARGDHVGAIRQAETLTRSEVIRILIKARREGDERAKSRGKSGYARNLDYRQLDCYTVKQLGTFDMNFKKAMLRAIKSGRETEEPRKLQLGVIKGWEWAPDRTRTDKAARFIDSPARGLTSNWRA